MPADEGALERFLASALATILTIIFSWHIIIDVYNDDNKSRRRQINDVTPPESPTSSNNSSINPAADNSPSNNPQPSSSSSSSSSTSDKTQIPLSSPVVTSPHSYQPDLAHENSTISSIIKEYKLTPQTLSRLEAIPDPIEIEPCAGRSTPNYASKSQTDSKPVPVLSSRTVPEEDSLDVRLLNRDISRVLDQSRDILVTRASPDDFDSVPLLSAESSPVDHTAFTARGIHSNLNSNVGDSCVKDSGHSNGADCDSSLKSSASSDGNCDKSVTSRKRGTMFDESWDMDPADEDYIHVYGDDQNRPNPGDFFFIPVDYDDSSEEEGERHWRKSVLEAISEEDEDDLSSSYNTSSEDEDEDEEGRFSDDSLNIEDMDDTGKDQNLNTIKVDKEKMDSNEVLNSTPLSDTTNSALKDSYFDISIDKKTNGTANLDGDIIAGYYNNERLESDRPKMASEEERIFPPVDVVVDSNRFSPSSPLLNEQTRQLCSSCEGLNTLVPSLSSLNNSGIVGRASLSDLSTMTDKTTSAPVFNGDSTINISNFDDSKLELFEESYRDSDLSDSCQPTPRGFIFTQSEELETKSEILASNYVNKENKNKESTPGAAVNSTCGVDVCIDSNKYGYDQYPVISDKSDLNSEIISTDKVYVIDLKDGDSVLENSDQVRNELLAQEEILDQKILVASSENSSGDESSTTTGETAILNPGTRETTDDDVSEISEIDFDIIKELQSVVAEPPAKHKHRVTDLDASDTDTNSTEEDSDSSASFEFNKDDSCAQRLDVSTINRNLAVLDELEEEDESSNSEEFHDASPDVNKFNIQDFASSGSSSSVEDITDDPYSACDSSLSSSLHPEIIDKERSIVKRRRQYSGMVSVPEVGFFPNPKTNECGTQTVRSYRQPAVCTIDPERYFHPYNLDKTPFDVTTEYSTGEVEVRHFIDVGIQVKFDPLWDKTEQRLVLSPSATPTRGSPVPCEGKLQPKELFFQYDNDVFSSDKFEPEFDTQPVTQRRPRTGSERRPSYEAIDESEEDLLEDSFTKLDSPPKSADNKMDNASKMNVNDDDVIETTVTSCKIFDESSSKEEEENVAAIEVNNDKPGFIVNQPKRGISEVLCSTEISTKLFDRQSSSSSDEEQVGHRSPPKRRQRKSPTKTQKSCDRASSGEDGKLVLERVHIEDSSDADDETDEEACVPLVNKAEQSPLVSPSSPSEDTVIKPIVNDPKSRQSPPRVQISPRPRPVPTPRVKPQDFISTNRVSPEIKTNKPLYDEFSKPEKNESINSQESIPHPKPVPRQDPAKAASNDLKFNKKPVETKNLPKVVSKPAVPERRVQSAMKIDLQPSVRPTPLNKTEASIQKKSPSDPNGSLTPTSPVNDSKYNSVLKEPVVTENKNLSHLFTLPDKNPLPEREKINSARLEYMKTQQQNNEEERKKLLSRLLGTRDWSEREAPKPKSILKKTTQSFSEPVPNDLPVGYKPTNLDAPNLAQLCKSTENIKDRISRVVERKKEEDRERSRSRSCGRSSEFERGRPERRTLPANFRSNAVRAKSLDSLVDSKSMSLPRSDSSGSLYRSPSMTLGKGLTGFFSDRKSYTNLMETDIDNDQVKMVPLVKETDLDAVSKNVSSKTLPRVRSKSENRGAFKPIIAEVYNDTLEKTKSLEHLSDNKVISLSAYDTPEVVPVKRDSNRLSKSLGRLDLPDWYVNAPRKPEDVDFGLSCTKTPPSSTSTSFDRDRSFRSNTSMDFPRSTVIHTRVSPPRKTPSPKPAKPFELPSERFRRAYVPLATRKIVSKMRPPGSKSMEDLVSNELKPVEIENKIPSSDCLSQVPVSTEKEMPISRGIVNNTMTKPVEPEIKVAEEVKPIPNSSRPVSENGKNRKDPVEDNSEKEIVTEPEKTKPVQVKPESRFTSSATVQLKPAIPAKPVILSAPKPAPVQKVKMSPTKSPTHEVTPSATIIRPVAPPPSLPLTKPEITEYKQLSPKEEIKDSAPKLAESIFDIPFVDESPQNEEAPPLGKNMAPGVNENFKPNHQEIRNEVELPHEKKRPIETAFVMPEEKETAFEVHQPRENTFEKSVLKDINFERQKPKDTVFENGVGSTEFVKPSTQARLNAPVVASACQPHEPKTFTTTPTQFYALNVIETDLDTSTTISSQRSQESLNNVNYEHPVNMERKWAPHEANVGAQIRHTPMKKPTPIETSLDNPRSPRIDDVTPRSPRETSFVSKASPKLDSNPSSPRETSFLSKGKERSHFVFPKPDVSQAKDSNIDEISSRIPAVKRNDVRPTETLILKRDDDISKAPNLQTFQRQVPPVDNFPKQAAPMYKRPIVTTLETSIDSSPTLQRHQRHPPEPSPIPNYGPRQRNSNFTTSTPVVRNPSNGPRSFSRGISRETDIDADIIQQPLSAPVQFEKSLDNDSFRFVPPQSESTPLNMSLESNSSFRQARPRTQSNEAYGDYETPQRPPPRTGPPPVPYRQPRAPPPPPPGHNRGPMQPPRAAAVETDIDGDLPPARDRIPNTRQSTSSMSSRPGSLSSRPRSSRPGSTLSHGSISDGYFEPEVDLATFKRMASEDPLVSTSSPRASPLDSGLNHAPGAPVYTPDNYIAPGAPGAPTVGFSSNVRIDHSHSIYRPPELESPHNSSLVEVLDGLLGMDNSSSNADDFSDPNRKRTVSEAKFDIFNDIHKRLNEDLTMVKCRNLRCGKTLPLRQARTVYVSCTLCYSYYCTENCRSLHYTRHEEKCSFARVEISCKLVARRLSSDPIYSRQICGIARNGYQTKGRGCVLVILESTRQCEQVIHSGRTAVQLQQMFVSMNELDSNHRIGDNAMDLVVEYNPNADYVLNVCCQISKRKTVFIKHCESLKLMTVQTPVISVNDKLPREQWFFSIQNQLRERGVDLRRQYPDVYNQVTQYVQYNTHFSPITIYPVDSVTGQTLLCTITKEQPADLKPVAWNRPQGPAMDKASYGGGRPPIDNRSFGQRPPTDNYRPSSSIRPPPAQQRPLYNGQYAPSGRQGVSVGAPNRPAAVGRPMYQPPRRAVTNPAAKETEL